MRSPPYPSRLAATLGLGPDPDLTGLSGGANSRPLSPSSSSAALPRPRSARRLSSAAGGGDGPGAASTRTSGRASAWLSLPPHAPVVALCTAATVVAYIERAGFAIAYARAASGVGGAGASSGHEGATGAVLAAFYWGYALSQVSEEEEREEETEFALPSCPPWPQPALSSFHFSLPFRSRAAGPPSASVAGPSWPPPLRPGRARLS